VETPAEAEKSVMSRWLGVGSVHLQVLCTVRSSLQGLVQFKYMCRQCSPGGDIRL
jgi:hypothetical protein